jgi:hypothetical protein
MAVIKLVEDYAVAQLRKDVRDSLTMAGEQSVLLKLWHAEDHGSVPCPQCGDDIYKSPEKDCPSCYGTMFDGGVKEAVKVWALYTDHQVSEQLGQRGVYEPDHRHIQFEAFPLVTEHDVVVRVRHWNSDGTPTELEGFYLLDKVDRRSLRTGSRFGQYTWDVVGQKCDLAELPDEMGMITRYPILGRSFEPSLGPMFEGPAERVPVVPSPPFLVQSEYDGSGILTATATESQVVFAATPALVGSGVLTTTESQIFAATSVLAGSGVLAATAVSLQIVTITTTGSTFAPRVELVGGSTATVQWNWPGGSSTGLTPAINFGSAATRAVAMTVTTPTGAEAIGDVRTLNLGYDHTQDSSIYNPPATYDKAPEAISAIANLKAMTGLVLFFASNTNLSGSLDFSGMSALTNIECFDANLSAITLTGCTALVRLDMETNNLTALDLNPVAASLYDLRCADQSPPGSLTLTPMASNLAHLFHFCTRDQPVVNQPPFSRFPALLQLWNWNTNQSGVLAPASSVLQELRSFSNGYSNIDLTGCPALNYLDLRQPGVNLPQATVDDILVKLAGFGVSNGGLVLTNNTPPSATGLAAKTTLEGRGWSVLVDSPITVGLSGGGALSATVSSVIGMPTPVSRFDFHEGSGATANSIVPGGYTLTATTPASAWKPTGDAAQGEFSGVVGPAGVQTHWTVAFQVRMTAINASNQSFGKNGSGSNCWYNISGSTNAPPGNRPGPWPPDQFAATAAIPADNLPHWVVYAFAPTAEGGASVYLDGVLIASFPASGYTVDFSTPEFVFGQVSRYIHQAVFYTVTLTPAQVAALGSYLTATLAGAGALSATAPRALFFDDFHRVNGPVGNGWSDVNGGFNGSIVNNQLVRSGSGSYQLLVNSTPAALPADYSVEVNVPHSVIANPTYFFVIARGFGGTGVRVGWEGGATTAANLRIGTSASFASGDVTVTADNAFPASWSVNQNHTIKVQMVGSLINVILDGVLVAHGTLATNSTTTGTACGIGGGDPGTYNSVTVT